MRVLIIDDESNIRKTTGMVLETLGHEVVHASDGNRAKRALDRQSFDAAFLDLNLGSENGLDLLPDLLKIEPGLVLIGFTAFASLETAIEAIKRGAYDYIAKPFTPEQIRQVFRKIEKTRRLESRVAELEARISEESPVAMFQTTEPAMQRLQDLAQKAAMTPATILILGESGTGKSILARAIHEQSARKDHPFVTANCPSLSRELLESEMFGHVKGAYTGAISDTWGKVAVADGGTLFLDEIGEMPLEIQPKLLRLLQEKEYERVGDPKPRRANVRVIAATNRNLEQAVKNGEFREDLYYRLNVIMLELPPLRERMGDLVQIAEHQLRFFSGQLGKKITGFSDEALTAMKNYSFPGNLRELANAIERATILSSGPQIELGDLPEALHGQQRSNVDLGALISLDELEKEHIKRILGKTSSLEQAAQVLGIDPATLYRKRKKLNLMAL